MKKFDYREYLTEGWLLKESNNAAKDAFLNRQKRAEQGNWKKSIGDFVENHGAELGQAYAGKQLAAYVEQKMKPALGPEAQQELDNLLRTCKNPNRLMSALYNYCLKGVGLGLHESEDEGSNKVTGELSLYSWVENNCKTLDDILKLNPGELREPISVAKEDGLSPREFIEDWVTEYGDWVDIAEMLGLKAIYGPEHKTGSLYLHEGI